MTEFYKSYRIIDGKPRWIIIDKDENIINRNPNKEELKGLKSDSVIIRPPTKRIHLNFLYLEDKYGKEFVEWVKENKDKVRMCVINTGCKTEVEYLHKCAKKAGFKDYNERQKIRSWENGKKSPADENSDCSFYISNKTERYIKTYLSNYFESVKGSGKGSWDGGIDIYCRNPKQKFIGKYQLDRDKEYHFQVKARCLDYDSYDPEWSRWKFPIRTNRNNIPDFWIFVGLFDREDIDDDITPEYSWLIYRDEIIDNHITQGMKLYERDTITISNSDNILYKYKEYEIYPNKDNDQNNNKRRKLE